jgi:hypothetical protein
VQHPSHYRILTLFGEPIFGFCALSTVGADCARLAVGAEALDRANPRHHKVALAKAKGQAAAMGSAATLRAKLASLMVERVEVGNPGDFDGLTSTAAIVDRELELLIERFIPVDERDRELADEVTEDDCAIAGHARRRLRTT